MPRVIRKMFESHIRSTNINYCVLPIEISIDQFVFNFKLPRLEYFFLRRTRSMYKYIPVTYYNIQYQRVHALTRLHLSRLYRGV